MKTKMTLLSNFTRFTFQIILVASIISTAFLFNSCKKNIDENAPPQAVTENEDQGSLNERTQNTNADMVLTWNKAGLDAVTRIGGLPPMPQSRIFAMINVAMHDALNTIHPKYERYALTDSIQRNASSGAAVAQAAHDVIIKLVPPQTAYADSLLQVSLSSITDGGTKTRGIKIGKAAAAAMIAKRQNDGASTAQFTVAQGTLPGQYQSTSPNDVSGFMAVPGWGNITPFSLHSGDMYRPEPPYAVNSPEYTKDFNQIKSLGINNSSMRTADQTEIGLFWLESVPSSFNRIARNLAMERGIDAWKTARLLSLLQMAEADANIASFNAKYYYFYWRPITAVRLADADGNDDTKGDSTWQILAPPTPPIPDYPSNHATNGGAAAKVIQQFFQGDNFSFTATSTSLPNVSRSFTSLSQAERECSLSRIYVGYHFHHAVVEGQKLGEKIGLYVFLHSLKPVH